MTDGPYAPPSMSRQWKDLARAVRLSAFEEEGPSRFREALSADARRECIGDAARFLSEKVSAQAHDLFGANFDDILNAARQRFVAPMAQSLFDTCAHAARRGCDPKQAIEDGLAGALRDRARDGCHSIEHHTMQEAGVDAARDVQRRCEAILQHANWAELAAEVTRNDQPAPEQAGSDDDERTEVGPPL